MFTVHNNLNLVFPALCNMQSSKEFRYTLANIDDFIDKYSISTSEFVDGNTICKTTIQVQCPLEVAESLLHLLYYNRVSPSHVRDVLEDFNIIILN